VCSSDLPIFRIILVCFAFVLSAFATPAQEPIDFEAVRQTRVMTAVRITDEISLDGRLEERAWELAAPAKDFIQRVPRLGAPASDQTEIRILYDDKNLYIGAKAFDSDPKHTVISEITEDFSFFNNDVISVVLDTLHDRRSGFAFVVNPAGARYDVQISNDGVLNADWDGVWDVKVSRDREAWYAEFSIPFNTLRFSSAAVQEWGVNITRAIRYRNEESVWTPVPVRYRGTRVSLAGTLQGLENIRQGLNLYVKPFVTAGLTQQRAANEMTTVRSLTRFKDYDGGVDAKYSLNSSLTLDATYRTDFAQVEADQQQVNLTRFSLFFPEKRNFFLENSGTFSFGPGGNLVPFFSRRIGLNAAGNQIPIVGGARVSGKISQYDVGFLAMKTEKLGGTPSNSYTAGRVKRNLLRNSWVGALVTSRDSTTSGDYNRVYGSDAHFQFYDKLEFDSYLLGSNTPGREGKNQARRFQTGWVDDELTVTAQYNQVQANFNPEVGFIRRPNNIQYAGEFFWRPLLRQSDLIRNLTFGSTIEYFEGGSGNVETRSQDLTLGIQFESNANANFIVTNTFDRLTSSTPIQRIVIPAGDYGYLDYTANFTSNATKKLSGNGSVNWGEFWNGRRRSTTAGLVFKPNYHFSASLNHTRNVVKLAGGASTTDLVGTRFIYGFTPRSFFNAFVQYNGDTHEISTNIRFNITYRPLSDLYLVYNDRRNSRTDEPIERAFIVKLTNLFTF